MRRIVALSLVALLGLVGTACDPQLSRKATGTFNGTTTVGEFGTSGCQLAPVVHEATYVRRQGAPGGELRIDGCADSGYPEFDFRFTGTYVLTTRGGATLRGPATGGYDLVVPPEGGQFFSLDFTLTVTDGTKRFARATGVVLIEGTWNDQNPGTFEGTITALLQNQTGQSLSL